LVALVFVAACGPTTPETTKDAGSAVDGAVDIVVDAGADVAPCALDCDDDNPCTSDGCDAAGACLNAPVPTGTSCGKGLHCDKGHCGPETMLLVPAGDLWQGCNEAVEGAQTCQHDEYPQHRAFVTAFWLSRLEVSVSDYGKCVSDGSCPTPLRKHGVGDHGALYNWGADGRGKHPINGVGWQQAVDYCKWRLPGGRLASESEWEKAARGACELHPPGECAQKMQAYPWGNSKPDCKHAIVALHSAAEETGFGCGKGVTWPVGSAAKDLGPYGHQGLGGNVSEWIESCYVADFYEQFKDKLAVDPVSPCDSEQLRGVRGGGFYDPGFDSRASYRHGHPPDQPDYYVGFRCARDVKAPAK